MINHPNFSYWSRWASDQASILGRYTANVASSSLSTVQCSFIRTFKPKPKRSHRHQFVATVLYDICSPNSRLGKFAIVVSIQVLSSLLFPFAAVTNSIVLSSLIKFMSVLFFSIALLLGIDSDVDCLADPKEIVANMQMIRKVERFAVKVAVAISPFVWGIAWLLAASVLLTKLLPILTLTISVSFLIALKEFLKFLVLILIILVWSNYASRGAEYSLMKPYIGIFNAMGLKFLLSWIHNLQP